MNHTLIYMAVWDANHSNRSVITEAPHNVIILCFAAQHGHIPSNIHLQAWNYLALSCQLCSWQKATCNSITHMLEWNDHHCKNMERRCPPHITIQTCKQYFHSPSSYMPVLSVTRSQYNLKYMLLKCTCSHHQQSSNISSSQELYRSGTIYTSLP